MIQNVHPGSGSRILIFLLILDPGSRGQRSRIRIRNTRCNIRTLLLPYFKMDVHIVQGKLEEEETVKKQLQPPPIKPVMPPPGISLLPNQCCGSITFWCRSGSDLDPRIHASD